MPAFSYRAIDERGKLVRGVVEGDSERQARGQLRARQLRPVEVQASSAGREQQERRRRWFAPRISTTELSLLTRQLATLVQSGMPLAEALTAAAQQNRRARIKSLMLQVRSRVVEGHSLAYALGEFPRVFSEMYRAMVTAGERAGFLGPVLERLAEYTESRQHTQQKLQMAMIYPLILAAVAVGVITLLMVFVVPQLVGLFTHSNAELPALTRGLIAVSAFFENYLWHGLVLLAALVWGLRALFRAPSRRRVLHRALLRLPFISGLLVSMDTARFASTLSILVSSGVPLLEGLRIAGQVLANTELREASGRVAVAVQEGSSLNRALADTDRFPPMMVHMVASGEASGELEAMLARAASNQERELELTLGTMMAVFEPLMVVLMAVIVGVIVLAILLPIIEMNNLVA